MIDLTDIDPEKTHQIIKSELTWIQRIIVMIKRKIFYKNIKRNGWKAEIPHYIVKCPNEKCQKFFIDYPHGHRPYFKCPHCQATIIF